MLGIVSSYIYKTVCRSVAQPGSASGLGPEGREFESLHSDHFTIYRRIFGFPVAMFLVVMVSVTISDR